MKPLKPLERDELFGRLDERTLNIYALVEKQEKHLKELNDRVNKNMLDIANGHNRLDVLEQGVHIKLSRGQLAVGGSGIISIMLMVLLALGKVTGWW